ncbi:MAG: TGS domain-containing protein, partial [Planctomycetes bacterium]|nr:TGS domain-containing protein [Planctomycetota bacterium]
MAKVQLPNGDILDVPDGTTIGQIAEQIGPGLAKAAICGCIDDDIEADLATPIKTDISLSIITGKDQCGLEIMRHGCAHVMAEAICSIWPEAKLVYGPAVRDGFYYDIDLDEAIRPEDFERIEKKMAEIVKADIPFKRIELSRAEALERVKGDLYKTDNIDRADGDVMSFYSHGETFEDLCRGPHVPSTGKIGSFKVMSVAGAYW